MNDQSQDHDSILDLVSPFQLAFGALGLGAFCAADVLWRLLPLIQ